MKMTIFGATGRTGQYLLQQALQAGHEVTVLVRTPEKLAIENERLTVIQGDISSQIQVDSAVAGAEVVLSTLGPSNNKPEFTVSQGTEHIIAAMDKYNLRRLIISAGAGVADPNDAPTFINKAIGFLLRTVSGNVYEDMVRTVAAVRASDLDWTIVRVPMLTGDQPKGDVRVAYVGKGMGSRVSRADLAAFMLQQIDSDTYIRQAPAISS